MPNTMSSEPDREANRTARLKSDVVAPRFTMVKLFFDRTKLSSKPDWLKKLNWLAGTTEACWMLLSTGWNAIRVGAPASTTENVVRRIEVTVGAAP